MQVKPLDLTEFLVALVYGIVDIVVSKMLFPFLALASPLAWVVESLAVLAPVLAIGLHRIVAAFSASGVNVKSEDTIQAQDNQSAPPKQGGN